MEKLEIFKKKLLEATTVVASVYPQGSSEFIRTDKEQVAVMIEMYELKKLVAQVLEELKKINAIKIEAIEDTKSTTTKTATTKK
jgi:hypothetical protein